MAAFLLFIQAYAFQSVGHAIAAVFSLVITVGVFRRAPWAFWTSAGVLALSAGETFLELQVGGYSSRSEPVLLCSLAIALAAIIVHQMSRFPDWFGIVMSRPRRVGFWVGVGLLTVVGELMLPILRRLIA
jgi:hypothetical protein